MSLKLSNIKPEVSLSLKMLCEQFVAFNFTKDVQSFFLKNYTFHWNKYIYIYIYQLIVMYQFKLQLILTKCRHFYISYGYCWI